MMFSDLLNERVPEGHGDTLWNQCLERLKKENAPVSISTKEVDRLASLVAHRIRGDFHGSIEDVIADVLNGFQRDLPF